MVKNIITVFVLLFIILYAIQIAAFHSLERLGSKKPGTRGLEGLEVSIKLGAKPWDKFIPGLGGARLITGEPCRVEVTYKDLTEWKTIKKQDDVDLDKEIVVYTDSQKIYVNVPGIEKRFELEWKAKK
jgi:hypothetical protein